MTNEALRLFRVFHDLRLYQMADILGISPSYLSEIEKGRKNPSLRLIEKYAKVFHTTPSTILSFSEKLDKDQQGIKAKIAKMIVRLLKDVESAANR